MSSRLFGPQTAWRRFIRAVDWVVVVLVTLLITLALINLNSLDGGDWSGEFVTDQIMKIAVGGVCMVIAATIDYRVYYRAAIPIYGVALGLVVLATVVGVTTNSATRWLELGFLRFQPSELMKLAVVVALARVLHDHAARKRKKRLVVVLVVAAMVAVPATLIVRQPNLSTGIMVMLIAGSILAATELDLKSMLVLIIGGIASFTLAWVFVLQDYQVKRIDVWLDPDSHPDGAYQVLQARTAIGNGGFLGRGIHEGTQNRLDFVPYSESDFSFAVFAEEWGFVGSSVVLLLFLALVLWSISLASSAQDRFGAILCAGVGAMTFWHVLLNVGVVLGIFPNTGLPLPFFSHGGSNVVTMMLAFGVLLSVSRSRKWR